MITILEKHKKIKELKEEYGKAARMVDAMTMLLDQKNDIDQKKACIIVRQQNQEKMIQIRNEIKELRRVKWLHVKQS